MLKKLLLCVLIPCMVTGQAWGMENDSDMPGLEENPLSKKISELQEELSGERSTIATLQRQLEILRDPEKDNQLDKATAKVKELENKITQLSLPTTQIKNLAINGAYIGLERSVSKLITSTIVLIWQGQWKRLPGLSWLAGKTPEEKLLEAFKSFVNLKTFSTTEEKYKHLRALFLCDIEKISALSSAEERKVFQTIIDTAKNFDDTAMTSYLEEKYNQIVPTPKEPKAFAAHEQKLRNAAPQPEPQNLKAASAQAQTKPA